MQFNEFKNIAQKDIHHTLVSMGMGGTFAISLSEVLCDIDYPLEYSCSFKVNFKFGKARHTKKITVSSENLKTVGILDQHSGSVIPITYGSIAKTFFESNEDSDVPKVVH